MLFLFSLNNERDEQRGGVKGSEDKNDD